MSARTGWVLAAALLAACAPKAPLKPRLVFPFGDPIGVESGGAPANQDEMIAAAMRGAMAAQASLRTAQAAADRCPAQRPRELSPAEERAAGEALARVWVSKGGGLFLETPAADDLTRYVNRVGRLLAARSSRPELPWTFGVLRSDEPVATSAPGGTVFVSRGALRLMTSEAQLAGVLAHQVGHVALRHDVRVYFDIQEQHCRSRALNSALRQTLTAGGPGDPSLQSGVDTVTRALLAKMVAQMAVPMDEPEADAAAFEMLARAGYNPGPWEASLDAVAEWQAASPPTAEARRQKLTAQRAGAKDLSKLPVVPLKDELKAAR